MKPVRNPRVSCKVSKSSSLSPLHHLFLSPGEMNRTTLFLFFLALLQHAHGFSSTTTLTKRPTHNNDHKVNFQRVLTLRGGEVDSSTEPVPPSQMAGISALLLAGAQTYSKYLESNPIATKSVTACFIFAMSDLLAQKLEGKKSEDRDWKRTLAASLIGLLYFGPAAHYWYENIFRLFPGK
jgi:hypothetical protein